MHLRFDFCQKVTHFHHPVEVISTYHLDEVIAKLKLVEQAVEQGFYAAGYLAYEAAPAFHPYLQVACAGKMPLLWFAIFRQIETNGSNITPATNGTLPDYHWQAETSYQQYQQAIETVRQQIAAGNTYQVNYTVRLNSHFSGDSYQFYLHLLNAQRAQYSAYLDIGDFQILSASPELFFHFKDNRIITKPMKGTAPRGKTYEQDLYQYDQLSHSEKNQAENVMIVDLLRNDLSQIAIPGSVKVDKLFEVEKYPTVWQMTSTIEAQTPADITLTDMLRALFPCGSITGAPKASTMKLIAELESGAREVYCGAVGYITPNKEVLFNVPIRTVMIDKADQTMRYGVGGGITWDSTAQDEYQETLNKAQVLKGIKLPEHLLESLRLEQGEYWLLEQHLLRLKQSAAYFDFKISENDIRQQLKALAHQHAVGQWKIRLLLSHAGKITLQAEEINPINTDLTAHWSPIAINSNNRLLYHKTTLRDHYPDATLNQECLLYNERNEITEFVNGNVALLLNDVWLTPPIDCGLLPGTMRASLLEQGKIHQAVISRDDLAKADKIAFFNSVRGWRNVIWQP